MARNVYEDRLIRVVDYIHDNLDGDLSLDTLADVAAMSRFHWHRVFHAMTGETLAQTTRRIRLYRASVLLVTGTEPIPKVASRCGYANTASFTRAFSESFGLSPGAYRKRGIPAPPVRINARGDFEMYDVEIRNEPARRLAIVHHRGDYLEVGAAFEKAAATIAARPDLCPPGKMIGVYLDDPDAVPADELRSMAGCEVPDGPAIAPPLEEYSLAGGRHAVLNHVGPYTGLHKAYAYLFGDWLPKSGEEPGDTPPFELYVNTPHDTRPDDLVTLISVPLKG